ncbi:homeobox protein otx5-b [Plakobranchus ocellatus]|uniref:Homeobox protein otx5-b n=1 Tax=Plakobranchus ocellatus TaxID=259542 RepID=A0AAV4AS71_9GAST|nr:homeobox protein otx5-b [Plakobranchus ocellatus]
MTKQQKYLRVRTSKLRTVISPGLTLPYSVCPLFILRFLGCLFGSATDSSFRGREKKNLECSDRGLSVPLRPISSSSTVLALVWFKNRRAKCRQQAKAADQKKTSNSSGSINNNNSSTANSNTTTTLSSNNSNNNSSSNSSNTHNGGGANTTPPLPKKELKSTPPPASVSPVDYKPPPPVSSPLLHHHPGSGLPAVSQRRDTSDVWNPANPMFQPMPDLSSCMQRSHYGLPNGGANQGSQAAQYVASQQNYNSYHHHHYGGGMDSPYSLPNMQLSGVMTGSHQMGGVPAQHGYQMSGYGALPSANTLPRPNTQPGDCGEYKDYVRLF